MEPAKRELILAVRDTNYSEKKIDAEISCIKKMLPYIENMNTALAVTTIYLMGDGEFKIRIIEGRFFKLIALTENRLEHYIHVNN